MIGIAMAGKNRAINKVLIANRGEIAVRVGRACRELGLQTVAVFSEGDRRSLHVRQADEAVCIGPSAATDSYLSIERILDAASSTGAGAIHPGYGFLSENADFAEEVARAGLVFVGPPGGVIRSMGNKIEARRVMANAGVPVVPGSIDGSDRAEDVIAEAERLEGPLMVKASSGGGGKGMRRVDDRADLAGAVREAIGEARSAFGDGTVYVEKCIENPRHVEFQVLADAHGNVVHLFERECSVQRRHQKVLEEAPSPALTPSLRKKMGEAAVAAARAVGYENAGTIEFMLDADGAFYFLEMNTRIQVEHPVTEMTTGVDLVQWQLRVARGEKLAFAQKDLSQRGHAMECRIYAEDETQNFMPSCGKLQYLCEPSGPGIRNDSGVYEGWEVSPHYDPMLSKLIACGEDRESARRRMLRALDEYVIHGVRTSIGLHGRILRSEEFISGKVDTGFLDRHAGNLLREDTADVPDEVWVAAALNDAVGGAAKCSGTTGGTAPAGNALRVNPWARIGSWEIGDES